MKHLSTFIALAVVVAACGQEPTVNAPPVGEPSTASSTTTTIVEITTTTTTVAAPPSTTSTTTTTMAAPPSTTSTTTTTTTTESPPGTNPSDPEIMTGTFYPTGTPVPVVLPEGAIGPSEFINGEDDVQLRDIVGAATHRMRVNISAPFEGLGDFVIESDVIEGASADVFTVYARWFASDAPDGSSPVFEVVLIDGGQYRRTQGEEWRDNSGGALFGWYVPPIVYSMLHPISSQITGSEWLGNEEIEGVPVGRYRSIPLHDSGSSSEIDVRGTTEIWIDADGVVWRAVSEIFVEGELWWSFDAVLYDVGADIVIEAPLVP